MISMRHKFMFLILAAIVLLSAGMARATDLRGRVDGFNNYTGMAGPLPGVGIGLFMQWPNGTFSVVRQTMTGLDGMYYFRGINPGQYVLQIGGVNYPLFVAAMPMQDIPIILR